MSVNARIKADTREVERLFRGLRGMGDRVTTGALNKVATTVHGRGIKAVHADLKRGVKKFPLLQRDIRAAIYKQRATRYNKRAILTGRSARRLPLILFGASQVDRGVRYTMRGRTKTIDKAFIAKLSSRQRRAGVYRRAGKKRFPVIALRGPSINQVFGAEAVQAQMERVAGTRWKIEIDRAVRLAIARIR